MTRRLGAMAVLAAATGLIGAALIVNPSALIGWDVTLLVAAAGFAVVGALLVARSAATRVGWALSLIGVSLLGSGLVAAATCRECPGGPLEAVDISPITVGAGSASWYATFAGIGMLMAWFPTGAPAGRHWRWLTPFGVVVTVLVLGASLLSERVCMEGDEAACSSWAANPIGIEGVPDIEYDGSFILGLLVAFILMAAISLVVRFVRSSGIERLQLKWFAAAVGLFASWLATGTLTELLGITLPEAVGTVGVGLVMLALPVAVGMAITRHRLFEIDRILSRTVTYGLVALVVAAVFATPVIALPRLLGESSNLVVAGSTLAAAAVFDPARRRIQARVDRRFNRARYDAAREVEAFAARLAGEIDLVALTGDLDGVIRRTIAPSASAVWLRARP